MNRQDKITNSISFRNRNDVLDFVRDHKNHPEDKNDIYSGIITLADNIRRKNFKKRIELCSIYNIKSGNCSEDCSFCAQSHNSKAAIDVYDVPDISNFAQIEKQGQHWPIRYFSFVSSGKRLRHKDLVKFLPFYEAVKSMPGTRLCASHGFLSYEQASKLKELGIARYHHNLESSENFFPKIVRSHSYAERLQTIKNAQKAGLEVCSGGIFGMGETLDDRIDLALTLKSLEITSIPINILQPIAGTKLSHRSRLSEEEILLSIALFRIINPTATLRIAGGRPLFPQEHSKLIDAGINGFMIGNYLTTTGVSAQKDLDYFKENDFELV